MLTIRAEQMAVFRDRARQEFEAAKVRDIGTRFPSWHANAGSEETIRIVRDGIAKARRYEIDNSDDVSQFIDLMIRLGDKFDDAEEFSWETEALREGAVENEDRVDLLMARLGLRSGFSETGDGK
jgi:hypothetical protein